MVNQIWYTGANKYNKNKTNRINKYKEKNTFVRVNDNKN